ncbi:MAG: translesion DNA synthesis-associated protein ImuA [Burkholderiales bacterium]
MNRSIETLLEKYPLWCGNQITHSQYSGIPTGFPELDALLPGGGWPVGALTEIQVTQRGIGELRLLMPALALLDKENRWLAWVAPPYIPYAPALVEQGINLGRILVIKPVNDADTLWAMEQTLRSGVCGIVLAWMARIDGRSLRRLQLAAEAGQTMAVLFCNRHGPSPCALRLYLERAKGKLAVHILKRRGSSVAAPLLLEMAAVRHSISGTDV